MRKVKFSIKYYKQKNITQHFLLWVQAFGGILDALVSIISLGFLHSNFEIEICFWRTGLEFKRQKRVRDSEKLSSNVN